MTTGFSIDGVDWTKMDGLIPAIVQDTDLLRVLMLGYLNREALEKTLSTGLVTFYSRSKQRLWQKGETSGHVLRLKSIHLDCDKDTFLLMAAPEGPTCHLGTQSCFGDDEPPSLSILADLAATIHARRLSPEPGSYTARLFNEGITRIAQKVGEEAVETGLAAATKSPELPGEAADLLYHLLVLLEASGTSWQDVLAILRSRQNKKQTPE